MPFLLKELNKMNKTNQVGVKNGGYSAWETN